MKVWGNKVLLDKYKCRFPEIQEVNEDGLFKIEIVVPKGEAKAVQDALYGGDEKIINFNKVNEKAKHPKKLWFPVYVYDEENKCVLTEYDEDLEEEVKVVNPDEVVFRFRSKFRPQIQYKKGLNQGAKIGQGSEVQVRASIFGSDEGKDENGKPLKYLLLSLYTVRVHTLVEGSSGKDELEEDDDFENEYEEEGTKSNDGVPNDGVKSNTQEKDF